MASETSHTHINQLRPRAGALSVLISIASLFVLIATVFSFPFPLVRPFWIREALGLTGIINGVFLMLLAYQIERMNLPAAVGGLGLIINDQIFVWRGFFILLARQEYGNNPVLFLAGAAAMDLFLAVLFILTARLIWIHHTAKRRIAAADPASSFVQDGPAGFSPLVVSGIIYAGFFLGIYGSLSLGPKYSFVVLKGTAQLAGLLSFVGAGVEMDYYVRGRQGGILCGVKILSHLLMLAAVFWATYQLMPIEKMIF